MVMNRCILSQMQMHMQLPFQLFMHMAQEALISKAILYLKNLLLKGSWQVQTIYFQIWRGKYVFSACTYKIINRKHGKPGCTRRPAYSWLTDFFFSPESFLINAFFQNNSVDIYCSPQNLDVSLFSFTYATNSSGTCQKQL